MTGVNRFTAAEGERPAAGIREFLPESTYVSHAARHDGSWQVVHSWPQEIIEELPVIDVGTESRRPRLRRSEEEVRELFDELRAAWAASTGASSSMTDIFMDLNYQRIIALGPQVVPLVVEDLRRTNDLWFWALAALAGRDVAVGAETVEGAAKRWIIWAEEQGYIA